MVSREWIIEYVESMVRAINSTPGWQAEGPSIVRGESGYQVSVLARHNREASARLIRSIEEWEEELRTHSCEGKGSLDDEVSE